MSSQTIPGPVKAQPLSYDWKKLMVDNVTIERQTGNNVNAEPTYAAPISIHCRVEYVEREYRTPDNLTRTSTCMVILDGVYGIRPQDRLTLSDGNVMTIQNVETYYGDRGPLYEAVLG
jgi:hypothetical protein